MHRDCVLHAPEMREESRSWYRRHGVRGANNMPIGIVSPFGYVEEEPRDPVPLGALLDRSDMNVVVPIPWPHQFGEPSSYLHPSTPPSWTVMSTRGRRTLLVHGTTTDSRRQRLADRSEIPRLVQSLIGLRRLGRAAWLLQFRTGSTLVHLSVVGGGLVRALSIALRCRVRMN